MLALLVPEGRLEESAPGADGEGDCRGKEEEEEEEKEEDDGENEGDRTPCWLSKAPDPLSSP